MNRQNIRARIESGAEVVESFLDVSDLSLQIGRRSILDRINISLPKGAITVLLGPSGAGKSSLLRCLNGLQADWQGRVVMQGHDVRCWPGGEDALRRHIGLIAQRPCVFPGTIAANVLFGLARRQRRQSSHLMMRCLQQAALWDEVRDRLDDSASCLSMGQQQRLCLARALAVGPQLLLLDEPTSSLDPRSRSLIEDSLRKLAEKIPLLLVSHDLEQAQRLADQVIFLCDGRVIEKASAEKFFSQPERIESREFIRWQVCDCD